VTAAQVRDVILRLIAAGHWRNGDPDILVICDAGYDPMRLACQLADLPVRYWAGCAPTGCCTSRRRRDGATASRAPAPAQDPVAIHGWRVKGPSSSARAGESPIRAATSWARARISASACRQCAAKHNSPIGERMVRAQ
jgi:hypothetical protein